MPVLVNRYALPKWKRKQSMTQSLRDIRHIDKTFYMGSDDRFYEPNYLHYVPSDVLRVLVEPIIDRDDHEWSIHRADVWTHIIPQIVDPARRLPDQGWKIHVSATTENCAAILTKVADAAVRRRIQFKFANDVDTLKLMTSKRWTRGGSGKFITIYPIDETEFVAFIDILYHDLDGFDGSYILSDRRYKDSRCLYYRYGGIRAVRRLDYLGRRREVLVSPAGEDVLDQRRAYFETPPWAKDPFPPEADDGQGELTLNDGRYVIKKALSFSNTGGVYLAQDTVTGEDVVVKEARPFVELGSNGQDATTRLAQEAKILAIASDLGITPRLRSTFWDWENFYLVEDYLDAEDMRGMMLLHSPLLRVNPTKADAEAFYERYRTMFSDLLEAIDRMHGLGIVIGDLSPTNIMVEKKTGAVRIIDLEGAFRPATDGPQQIYTPGFRLETKGREKDSDYGDDLDAAAAIMTYSMFPIAAMTRLRDDVFTRVLPVLVDDIGWARTPVLRIIRGLLNRSLSCRDAIALLKADTEIETPFERPSRHRDERSVDEIRLGLVRFAADNYRLEEPYTLFPIDPFGRQSNPLGLFFGATGIVATLVAAGEMPDLAALKRFREELDACDPAHLAPGLIVGAAGMAIGLLAAGEPEAARRFLDAANEGPLTTAHHSLYYGMAGIGLANLVGHQATGDGRYLDAARRYATLLEERAIASDRGVHWQDNGTVRIGLGYGQSGVALFLLRLSQVLNEPRWRVLGQRALEYDLSFGREIEPGVISFSDTPDDERTFEQYIEQGSGGIAKVAIRYGLWDRVDGMLCDMQRKYSAFAGLIYGLSGFVDVLVDAHLYSGDPTYLAMAERPLSGLTDLYVFQLDNRLAVPGENLFRVSCDYATGLCGVIATLNRWENGLGDGMCLDWLDGKRV